MVRLPLKEDIRNNPVPVPVKGGRILPVGVYEDLPLQNRGLPCVRSHIVQFLPAVHVLRDRLPVEKDNGNIRLHSLIDHAGRGGTVHHIDAEHVAAKIDHTLRLAVLRELISLRVPDIQRHADPGLFFIFLRRLLHGIPESADERVIPAV